jgi:hypothetical protein
MQMNKPAFSSIVGILLFSIFSALGGCSKEELKNTIKNYVSLFSAKIGGQSWLGTATWRSAQIPLVGAQTVITAMGSEGASGSSIVITVQTDKTGNYSIGALTSGNTAYYLEGQKRYDSISGSINFTVFDTANKRISGTFNMEVKNAEGVIKNITEGKFENLKQQL